MATHIQRIVITPTSAIVSGTVDTVYGPAPFNDVLTGVNLATAQALLTAAATERTATVATA